MALRSPEASGIYRDSSRCTHYVRMLITAWPKLTRHLASLVSRFGSTEVRFLIPRPRWREEPAAIRSTSQRRRSVNDAREQDASVRAAGTENVGTVATVAAVIVNKFFITRSRKRSVGVHSSC